MANRRKQAKRSPRGAARNTKEKARAEFERVLERAVPPAGISVSRDPLPDDAEFAARAAKQAKRRR
jgi:hypothetical protein